MARLGDWSHPGQLKPPMGHLLISTRKIIIEFGHMGDEKSWKPLWKPGDLQYFKSKIFLRSNIYKTELIFPLFLAVSIKLPHIISPWWKIDPWEKSQIELELALTKPMPTHMYKREASRQVLSLPRQDRLVASACFLRPRPGHLANEVFASWAGHILRSMTTWSPISLLLKRQGERDTVTDVQYLEGLYGNPKCHIYHHVTQVDVIWCDKFKLYLILWHLIG